MYAYVAASTCWTWEYIGQHLTLPRLNAMFKHWGKYPPVHVTAALFTGIKTEAPKTYKPVANVWDLHGQAPLDASAAAALDNVPMMPRRMPQ